MKMNETVAGLTITAKTEGVDQAKAKVDGLTQSTEKLGVVSETSSKGALSLEQSWKRATLRFDEAARAQAEIDRQTKLANKAVSEGLATQQQANQHIERVAQRYNTASQSTEKFAQQTGLARHELINLGRQAQDVGVSLVSGQSPLMVLAQQGSQIADVFISSGKSVGDFFRQAIDWAAAFAKTPAGIVTGILAIGGAAIYAASQFFKSSTTIEEAIKEQKRLLNETKTAVDDLITAQLKLQSKQLTQFELIRSELDLRTKLKEAMRETAEMAPQVAPTLFPGEQGAVPPEMAAGYEKIAAAVERLNAAREAGQPGMVAFANELGRIGEEEPALAKLIEKMVRAGQEGRNVEEAWLKVRAALQSAAQVELQQLQTLQRAEAAERMAQATLQVAAAYPGMSIEVAKQLNDLQGQLNVAEARSGVEKMIEQEIVTQNQLLLTGKALEEAIAVAAQQRALVQAHINAQADQTLKNLQNEYELIKATSAEERSRIAARQEYEKLVKEGVDPSKAGAIASQMEANARATRDATGATKSWSSATEDAADATESWSAANDDAVSSALRVAAAAEDVAYWANQAASSMFSAGQAALIANSKFVPFATTWKSLGPTSLGTGGSQWQSPQGGISQFDPAGYVSTTADIGELSKKLTAEAMEITKRLAEGVGTSPNLARELNEKLRELQDAQIDNTRATEANTEATATMTDVLSPFYSSDPRATHLGFRAFAGGGIMTPYGELPLKQYQGGGMATSPQVAVFGEGSTPEAYVPVPSGRIPVEIKTPANSNRPIVVNISVQGNADASTVAALKTTAFQQAQAMRRVVG